MKNIQVVDDAINTGYKIYAVTEQEFSAIFPDDGQNIEFIEDVVDRIGEESAANLMSPVWDRQLEKSRVKGIHGTLFYGLECKKKYYENKREPVIDWKLVD